MDKIVYRGGTGGTDLNGTCDPGSGFGSWRVQFAQVHYYSSSPLSVYAGKQVWSYNGSSTHYNCNIYTFGSRTITVNRIVCDQDAAMEIYFKHYSNSSTSDDSSSGIEMVLAIRGHSCGDLSTSQEEGAHPLPGPPASVSVPRDADHGSIAIAGAHRSLARVIVTPTPYYVWLAAQWGGHGDAMDRSAG